MFREADLVVMPSRTEGFGLVALEAISAGVSVLISRECGIAKALQAVDGGMAVVIPTASPDKWATKIQQLSEQTPDERYTSAVRLRENYEKVYNWKEESKKFEKMILQLATSPTPKETEITGLLCRATDFTSSRKIFSFVLETKRRNIVLNDQELSPILVFSDCWLLLIIAPTITG